MMMKSLLPFKCALPGKHVKTLKKLMMVASAETHVKQLPECTCLGFSVRASPSKTCTLKVELYDKTMYAKSQKRL